MRNKTVEFAGKKIRIEEKRIGELEQIVRDLFPESKGKLQKINLAGLMEQVDFDLLYKKLPVIIDDITGDDVKNAYMSELEELLEAFVDVNFTGIKRLIGPLMNMIQMQAVGAQAGSQQK